LFNIRFYVVVVIMIIIRREKKQVDFLFLNIIFNYF